MPAMRGGLVAFDVVDERMAAVLAQKTGPERLEIAWSLFRSAQRMLAHHLRREHADWSEEELAAEVARRLASGSG